MNGEIFIPIVLFISAALMVVAITFYRTRENLALIERGMNPRADVGKPSPFRYYKWGLLLIGLGTGLALAFVLDRTVFHHNDSEAIYFALMSIGAGLGLVFAHKAEKAWIESQPAAKPE